MKIRYFVRFEFLKSDSNDRHRFWARMLFLSYTGSMEINEVLRKKSSMLIDTIFSCFMLAFGRNSGGDQIGISPKLGIHEQAVLLAVMLNIQGNINVMSRGPEQCNADKQSELMRWLLGSSIVMQAVDKDYIGYIREDLVPLLEPHVAIKR
jgi:hypothetical protein